MPRLVPDQIVDVCLAGGWRRTVRVAEVGEVHADVVPIEGPAALPAGIELWEATIEWRADRGLARLGGVLTGTAAGLRFLETSGEVVMQRRRYVRVRCGVTVTVAGGDDPILTEATDLSLGGMLLTRADRLNVRQVVRFALAIGEGDILTGEARIVRGTPFGHRAISFEAMTSADERRLGRFIAEVERRQCAAAAALRGPTAGPARGSRPRAR